MTPQAKQAVEQSKLEASEEADHAEVFSLRTLFLSEGMMPILFVLPAVIAFFLLLAVPPI